MIKTSDKAFAYENVLLQGAWFSTIPASLRHALLSAAMILRVSAGQHVLRFGEQSYGMYGVIQGGLSVGRYTEEGKPALLAWIEPPQWFGEITLFDRQPRTHDIMAITDCVLIYVSGEALDHIVAQEPRYWQSFGLLLTGKLRVLMDLAEDLACRATAQRVAKRLVLIAESYGEWKDRSRRVLEIPQEQLAMMLFLTRQTTNQVLKELARLHLIKLTYGAIEILDIQGLKTFAEQND